MQYRGKWYNAAGVMRYAGYGSLQKALTMARRNAVNSNYLNWAEVSVKDDRGTPVELWTYSPSNPGGGWMKT